MDKNEVILEPYNKDWPWMYHIEKQCLIGITLAASEEKGLGYLDIRHIGSTSVEGMISKPIIDILVCTDNEVPVEKFIPYFEEFGYKNLGDGGRTGRYFLVSDESEYGTFHMHLCHLDNQVAQDQLLFQYLLRTNHEVFEDYLKLKLHLADVFAKDRISYRDTKGLFINSVLSSYRQGKGNPCFMD